MLKKSVNEQPFARFLKLFRKNSPIGTKLCCVCVKSCIKNSHRL